MFACGVCVYIHTHVYLYYKEKDINRGIEKEKNQKNQNIKYLIREKNIVKDTIYSYSTQIVFLNNVHGIVNRPNTKLNL